MIRRPPRSTVFTYTTPSEINTVDATMEKYRDNVRAALEALKKQHPDAEKHSSGYRQMEIHVKLGIREVEDSMLAAPGPYKPPLQIVRQDLITMDERKSGRVGKE